jgi:hypothetical protein
VNIGSSTASTSETTGALIVRSGGIGVGGSSFFKNIANFNSSNQSTSETTGALIIPNGGIGVGGSSYFKKAAVFNDGTHSTSSTTGAITVVGGIGVGGTSYFGKDIILAAAGSNITQAASAAGPLGINTTNNQNMNFNVGTGTLSITAGNVYTNTSFSAPAFYYTSDRRLKENIKTTKGLETILGLRGVTFDWIKTGEPEVGLIAQEVEKVLPELVKTSPSTGLKSVKYGNLVAPLIEAVKDLYKMLVENIKHVMNLDKKFAVHDVQVKRLESEVQKLKDENARLKADVEEIKKAIRKK